MPDEHVHLPHVKLAERISRLDPPPRDAGLVALVVVRPEVGTRKTPSRCRLSPEAGVEDDRWSKREKRVLDAQISVMRADVARVIANGQSLDLSGDNLLVDIDLSPENLPAGTRVRIGAALCEVTPKPHTGCAKFAARFGQPARDITGAAEFASLRLRGLYVKVIEAGEVSPGDAIVVLDRAFVTAESDVAVVTADRISHRSTA